MKISFSLSVVKGTDLNAAAEYMDAGLLQMCTNECAPYPYHASEKPELVKIRAEFTINDSYPVCNLYNLIQHWINVEDHILVHNLYLLPQFKNNRYNSQSVKECGIKDGDIIYSNRIYQNWNLGEIRMGTLFESGNKYFINPDNQVIQLPGLAHSSQDQSDFKKSWNDVFRFMKYFYENNPDDELKKSLEPFINTLIENGM